jgi:hypothetical protein
MKPLFALLAATALLTPMAIAKALELPTNGWATWQVAAAEGAPAWCCIGVDRLAYGSDRERTVCNLDEPAQGFGTRGRDQTVDRMHIHALVDAGRIKAVRAFAPTCPVKTDRPVAALGDVSNDWSATLLTQHLAVNKKLDGELLAALSVHAGDTARRALLGAASVNAPVERRKDAIFWMVQGRGREGFDMALPFLAKDTDPAIREHSAFALSQSRARMAAPLLIKAAQEDSHGKVRAQAWFWLSQTKAPDTERAIGVALTRETDPAVREQAVFALSQLKGDRAARALIAVADNRQLGRDVRRHAVFWLGQSGSPLALGYFDQRLAAPGTD